MDRGGVKPERNDRHDDGDFFESDLFHEASSRAGSNLFAPDAGPSAGGSPLEYEVFSWVPGRGGGVRPAVSLGLSGNGVQPAVWQRRSGFTNEPRDEDDRGEYRCPHRGGLPPSWRRFHTTLQSSGNVSHRRQLDQSPSPRAHSRGRRRTCLSGGATGHFTTELQRRTLTEPSQPEIGTRQRDVNWGRYGKTPRESTSRCPAQYSFTSPRAQSEATEVERSQSKAKRSTAGGRCGSAGGERKKCAREQNSRPWKRRSTSAGPKMP